MVFGVAFRPSAPVPSVVAGLCVVLFARRPVVHGHRGSPDGDGDSYADGAARTFGATVRHCLAGVDPLLPCVNERAMAALELAESEDSMSLGPDLEMTVTAPEDLAPKGVYSIGDNPYNFGAVIEAASSLLSRRTFYWDLSTFYPGLQMRVGPTYNGRGIIDFILNSRRKFEDRSLGFGQMIFKRMVLPSMLAAQISVASVIPLVFAAIYFLTKKAFLLSKIALIVTSVMGYGSLIMHYKKYKPFDDLFGGGINHPFGGIHHPFGGIHHLIGGNHPVREPHPVVIGRPDGHGFVGDIRGDRFYGNFDAYQQISSSKPTSFFRGVNYFPREHPDVVDGHSADGNKKEAQ